MKTLRSLLTKKKVYDIVAGVDELLNVLTMLQEFRSTVTKGKRCLRREKIMDIYGGLGPCLIIHLQFALPTAWVRKLACDLAEAVVHSQTPSPVAGLLLASLALGATDVGGSVFDALMRSDAQSIIDGKGIQSEDTYTNFMDLRSHVLSKIAEKATSKQSQTALDQLVVFLDAVETRPPTFSNICLHIVHICVHTCLHIVWRMNVFRLEICLFGI
jgi:hypothetical protein